MFHFINLYVFTHALMFYWKPNVSCDIKKGPRTFKGSYCCGYINNKITITL